MAMERGKGENPRSGQLNPLDTMGERQDEGQR
jgi:hypothetical protein